MRTRELTVFGASVAVAGLLGVCGLAAAQTKAPTQADFDSCNRVAEARVGMGTRSGSDSALPRAEGIGASQMPPTTPTPGSSIRGPSTPDASMPGTSTSPSMAPSATTGPRDQSLLGMDLAGRDNIAYERAYRDCMKGRGF
jgi:hypothetical protein